MTISQNLQNRLRADGLSYKPKLYVLDDNDAWVDLSSAIAGNRQDRLIRLGSVKHSVEKRIGVFNTTISDVQLRNDDGFFNGPPPPPALTTVTGTDASLSSTTKYGRTAFYRRHVKAAIQINMGNGVFEEVTLGVLMWDTMSYASDGTVNVRLKSFSDVLRDVPADSVTDGVGWYEAKPSWFLAERLLKISFADSSGDLPAEYNIAKPIQLAVGDGDPTLSAYGRPGDFAQASGESEPTWKYPTSICRAMVWGTVGSDTGLWLGLDNSVYFFDPNTESYVEKVTTTDLGSGYNVVYLYIHGTTLWGIAAQTQANNTGADEFAGLGVSGKVFSFDGTTYTLRSSETSMWTGRWAFRTIGQVTSGSDTNCVGQVWNNGSSDRLQNGCSLVVPFDQRLFFKNTMSGGSPTGYKRDAMYTSPTTPGTADLTSLSTADQITAFGIIDWTDASWTYPDHTPAGAWAIANLDIQGYIVYSVNSPGAFCVSTYSGDGGTRMFFFKLDIETRTGDQINMKYKIRATRLDAVYNTVDAGNPLINDTSGAAFNPQRPGAILSACAATDGVIYFNALHSGYGNLGTDPSYSLISDSFDNSVLWKYDWATSITTRIQLNHSGTESGPNTTFNGDDVPLSYWKLIEIFYFNSHLYGVWYSYTAGDWCIMKQVEDMDADDVTLIYRTPYQPAGIVHDTTNDVIYFYEVGAGRVGKLDTSDNITFASKGDVAVPNSVNLSCRMAIKQATTPVVWGVSAPYYSPDTQWETPAGKYYLWKLDTYITDRIELADFTDRNVWEALGLIAEATGAMIGFDVNGNFFMQQRVSTEATADLTLVHGSQGDTGDAFAIDQLTVNTGEDEIYNFVELVPSSSVVQDPSYDIRLRDRAKFVTGYNNDAQLATLDFYVDVRSQEKKTIKLVCSDDGDLEDTASKHLLKFKFLAVDRTIEAKLISNYTTGVTIYLDSVFGGDGVESGIHAGDWIIATDPDDEGNEEVKHVDSVSASANTIDIDSALSFDLNVNDMIKIVRKNTVSSTPTYSEWSDEGVTYTTAVSGTSNTLTVVSVENLAIGMVIQVEREQRRITDIDTSGANPVLTLTDLDGTARNWYTSHPAGSIVRAWWAPNALDKYFQVGNTGVFIKITAPTSGDYESRLLRGDSITVTIPGLKLQEDDHAKQTAVNAASVRANGRKDYPASSNPYLTRSLARNLAGTLVSLFKDPSYDIEATGRLGLNVDVVNASGSLMRVDVQSVYMFPRSSYLDGSTTIPYTVQCTVREITHDLRAGTSRIRLRGVAPY